MFGARLAALRKAAGMNQNQLAQILKISSSAVGMYEQGRREPSLGTLAAIADTFGVSIDFLVTGKPATEEETQVMENLIADRTTVADARLTQRINRPFSRQELAVLFAAMLMDR